MENNKYEEFLGWQKAKNLTFTIHKIFSDCNDYAFKEQLQKAAVSIVNNIAEGFERNTNKEFKQYLLNAKVNANEVRALLHVAHELGYINKQSLIVYTNIVKDIAKLIAELIKTL